MSNTMGGKGPRMESAMLYGILSVLSVAALLVLCTPADDGFESITDAGLCSAEFVSGSSDPIDEGEYGAEENYRGSDGVDYIYDTSTKTLTVKAGTSSEMDSIFRCELTTEDGKSIYFCQHYDRGYLKSDSKPVKKLIIHDSITGICIRAFGTEIDTFSGAPTNRSVIEEIVIGKGITSIDDYAFNANWDLKSVTFNCDNLTNIGERAFGYCSDLPSIEIPKTVETLGDSSFTGCSAMTSIVIPDSVTSIGDSAFADTPLTNVVIGSGVEKIGDNAFNPMSDSFRVEYAEAPKEYGESGIDFGKNVFPGSWDVMKTSDERIFEWNGRGWAVVYDKDPVAKPTQTSTSEEYNGEEHQFVLSGFDADKMTMTGQTSFTKPGTYTITVTLKNGYKWQGGGESDLTFTYTITPYKITLSAQSWAYQSGKYYVEETKTLLGNDLTLTYYVDQNGFPGTYTYSSTAGINNYAVTISGTNSDCFAVNTVNTPDLTITGKITVTKAMVEDILDDKMVKTYDGTKYTYTVGDNDYFYLLSEVSGTNAGTYYINVDPDDESRKYYGEVNIALKNTSLYEWDTEAFTLLTGFDALTINQLEVNVEASSDFLFKKEFFNDSSISASDIQPTSGKLVFTKVDGGQEVAVDYRITWVGFYNGKDTPAKIGDNLDLWIQAEVGENYKVNWTEDPCNLFIEGKGMIYKQTVFVDYVNTSISANKMYDGTISATGTTIVSGWSIALLDKNGNAFDTSTFGVPAFNVTLLGDKVLTATWGNDVYLDVGVAIKSNGTAGSDPNDYFVLDMNATAKAKVTVTPYVINDLSAWNVEWSSTSPNMDRELYPLGENFADRIKLTYVINQFPGSLHDVGSSYTFTSGTRGDDQYTITLGDFGSESYSERFSITGAGDLTIPAYHTKVAVPTPTGYHEYTGDSIVFSLTAEQQNYFTMTYNGEVVTQISERTPGQYTVTLELKDAEHFVWADSTYAGKTQIDIVIFVITKKTISLDISEMTLDRAYDGTDIASITDLKGNAKYTLVGDDKISITYSVGSYTGIFGDVKVDLYCSLPAGTSSQNDYYNLEYTTITMDAEITAKTISVDPNDYKITKVYDGTTDIINVWSLTTTGSYKLVGIVGNEEPTISVLSTSAFDSADAGKNIGFTLDFSIDDSHYVFESSSVYFDAAGTIEKGEISFYEERDYISGDKTYEFMYDSITVTLTAFSDDCGTYLFSATESAGHFTAVLDNDNYCIGEGTFVINKIDAIVTVQPVIVDSDLPYSNSNIKLLSTLCVSEGGTVLYSVSFKDQSSWSAWDVAEPTGLEPGIYYVKYKVEGDINYRGIDEVSLGSVSILDNRLSFKFMSDGKVIKDVAIFSGDPATSFTPSKDYHRFGGWYTDKYFGTLYDFDSPVTCDTVVYAKWTYALPHATVNQSNIASESLYIDVYDPTQSGNGGEIKNLRIVFQDGTQKSIPSNLWKVSDDGNAIIISMSLFRTYTCLEATIYYEIGADEAKSGAKLTINFAIINAGEEIVAGEDYVIVTNGAYNPDVEVLIDDVAVTDIAVSQNEHGQNVITIGTDVMSQYEKGEHTVKVSMVNGSTVSTFTITDDEPVTPAANNAMIVIAITVAAVMVGVMAFAVVLVRRP